MKRVIYPLLFLGLLVGYLPRANAFPMGSDISWTCLGQDSFLVTLVVYRDCNGNTIGANSIDFHCTTSGTLITSLSVYPGTGVDITPVCNTSCTRCQSSGCSFPYGIQRYTMQGIVSLNGAGSCCSITLSWAQCCRSSAITTISTVGTDNLYTEAKLDRCISPCDNSPTFNNPPVMITCVGLDVTFLQNTQDIDTSGTGHKLDSLTYEWVSPLRAAGSSINYIGQYTYNRAIYFWGFPNDALPFPRGLHLDLQNGQIQFRPMKAEITIMVVKVNEFRNGVKIAELRREMEVIVISCTGHRPIISTLNNVRSKNVCVGDTVSYTFSTIDTTSTDSIRLSSDSSIPGAIWTDSNGLALQPSATLKWVPTSAYVSNLPYTFIVTARSNTCPINMVTTQSYQITVKPKPQANIIVSDSGCGNYWFHAQRVFGSGPSYIWQGQNFNFNPPNYFGYTLHKFQPGLYPYSMTMTASGCSTIYYDTVTVTAGPYLEVTLPPDTAVCVGSSLSITPVTLFGSGKIRYLWSNGDTNRILNTGPINNLMFITLTVTDSIGCSDLDTIIITNLKYPEIVPQSPLEICFNVNNKYESRITPVYKVYGTNNYIRSFNWQKLGDTTSLSIQAELTVKDTGDFLIAIQDLYGCSALDTFTIRNSLNSPKITMNDIDICYNPNNKYMLKVNSFYQVFGINNFVSSLNWHRSGDTTILSNQSTLNTNDTGLYELTVTDKFGCDASKSLAILNSIKPPQITLSDSALICYNYFIPITITPAYQVFGSSNFSTAFKWQHSGDTSTLSTKLKLTTKDTGIYKFTVTDKYGCETSDSISIEPTQHIDTSLQVNLPIITATAGMKKYEWYRNDSLIYSGGSNILKLMANGSYYVRLFDYNGCYDSSRTIAVKLTSTRDDRSTDLVQIYPNPTTGKLMLEIKEAATGDINFALFNIFGLEILNKTFKPNELQTTKEIDISDQPAGTYTVIIRYLNMNFHQLIIKE
jgi:hypothetical protein